MIGKPNCSWSSNFRINRNLRTVLNWIWVSCFRQACVSCLIRGNTCAKHPWMGQAQIRTGLRIYTTTRSSFLSCSNRVGHHSPARPSLFGWHPIIPWRRFMSWLLKTTWKNNLSDLSGRESGRAISISSLCLSLQRGRPVRTAEQLFLMHFFIYSRPRVWDALLLQHCKKKLGENKQLWAAVLKQVLMTESMWFWLVIVLHFPAVVRDFHHQPNQPCRKHSPHLFSPHSNYIMWLKNILNRAFADFYLFNADLFHAEQ